MPVKETGEVERGVFASEIRIEIPKSVKKIPNVTGMRDMFYFPYKRLRDMIMKCDKFS